MTKTHLNFAQISLNTAFTFSFLLLLFCSISYGQISSTDDQNTANSYKSLSIKYDNPTADRPRVVSRNSTEKSDANLPEKLAQLSRFEHLAFDLLNQKRAEQDLSPLKWSEDMAKIARLHSQEMADYNYFSHAGRNGSMVNDRADALGISDWQAIGENIAFNRGYDKPAEFACEGWMNSTSHRENILNKRWKEAGIGAAIAADGSYYFTEVFILK